MSEQELEYFNLCRRLAEILGDDKAVANLKELYDRHPEMFKDTKEISHMIKEVVSEPEIIVDADRDKKDYTIIKAAKKLNDEKMGDVIIKNENEVNEIFHANKKRIKELERLKDKENLLQVETPTPSTHQFNGFGANKKNSSSANALSAIEVSIIPQNQTQSQGDKELPQTPNFDKKNFEKLSVTEKFKVLENNQNFIQNQKRASEILKHKTQEKQNNGNLENPDKENSNHNTNKRRHR